MRHAFAVSDNSRIRASSMSSSRRSIFKVWVDRCVSLYFSFLIIAVFTFSDIYFVGVGRVFDYIVLASIILFIAFCDFSISRRSFSSSVLLSAILFPWLLVGGINGYYLASAAVLVGALIVFPFFQSNVERQSDTFHSALKYAVVINIIMLVTQTYLFYFHGFFFDIHTIIGSIESRGFNESLRYFRPSGFFQEPNAYCAVMFCLLSIRVCFRQAVSAIDYFGILSMILTQSLWGFGASFIIIGLIIGFMKATFLVMIIASLAYVLLLLVGISVSDLAENSVTVARLMNIDDDPSRQARYGSVANWRLDEWFIFGNGVDTSNFQNVAANGVGFLFYSIGIVGLGLLSIWILIRERVRYKAGVSIIFLLTTFPPFAYMYFWVYLSLILTRPRLGKNIKVNSVEQTRILF